MPTVGPAFDVPTAGTIAIGLLAVALILLIVAGGIRHFLAPFLAFGHYVYARTLQNPADKLRNRRLRMFSEYLESRLYNLEVKELWRDRRFVELEAEVEIESHEGSVVRRESSLSVALTQSRGRLILLLGEPGTGKTVTLRHAAHSMLRRVKTSPRLDVVIPVYVDLSLWKPIGQPSAKALEEYVLLSMRRAADRDVDHFLDEEFQRLLTQGSWVFLLDSFDSIPAIRTSGAPSDVVEEYANAVYTFAYGLHACRTVLASRPIELMYRPLKSLQFTILALTERRKREFLRRADLPTAVRDSLEKALDASEPLLQKFLERPIFMEMWCSYARERLIMLTSAHQLLRTHLQPRLEGSTQYSTNDSAILTQGYEGYLRI